MGRVSGKVAVVTGAASGLGRAAALLLAREGARLVAVDLNAPAGAALEAEIRRGGGEALFLAADVAEEDSWRAIPAAALDAFGGLDILVNNAGIQFSKSVEETTLDDWRRIMRINVESVFLGTRAAIAPMRARGGGSIVNMSSTYGLVGEEINAAYCASKAAILNFSKSAALHCAKSGYNIRVNTVHPGAVRTPLTEAEMRDIARVRGLGGPEDAEKEWNAIHPLGRIGEPGEIAYGILYLASDESSFVTGSELVIDGGHLAQ